MEEDNKKKGCRNLLIKGVVIYLAISLVGSIFAYTIATIRGKNDMKEITALMESGDYNAAIEWFNEYWEENGIYMNEELVDLCMECYKAEGRYEEAANIIISAFRE